MLINFCLLISLFLLFNFGAVGQSNPVTKLFPITENGKYGYADVSGIIVIKPQFSVANEFSDGMAAVMVNDKWGFIDESGKIVIPPKYDEVERFSHGLAAVSISWSWGFIDKTGKDAIPAGPFVEVSSFSEGLAAVSFQPSDGKPGLQWGYIDLKGNVVIRPRFFKAFNFRDGIAMVWTGKFGEDNSQGFIGKTGEYLIKPKYGSTGEYSEGLIPVEIGGRATRKAEGVSMKISGKWGYMDQAGKLVIPAMFDSADEFSEGLANVTVGKKYGYVDKTGSIVIQPQFDYSDNSYQCAAFVEGRACFERDEKIGFIDTKGNVVIEPVFESASNFSNGISVVDFGVYPEDESDRFGVRENVGLISKQGKVIYRPENKKTYPQYQSKPVDPKKYIGWQKIDGDGFSFYAPPDLKMMPTRGIDSAVYVYKSSDLTISMDVGRYSVAEPSSNAVLAVRTVTIDGQTATISHYKNESARVSQFSSAIRFIFGEGYGKSHFYMGVSFNKNKNKNKNTTKDIAGRIFSSIRF